MSSRDLEIPFLLDLGDVPGITSPLPPPGATGDGGEAELFEVGVVYAQGSRLYLAVSPSTLITVRGGEPQEVRPVTAFGAPRSLPVEALCRAWGITRARLDRLTRRYVSPSADGVEPRARAAARRRSGVEELVGLVLRKVRVAG